MSDRTYCRLTLLYLFWIVVVSWMGLEPASSPGSDVFIWRAYIAIYPTVFFWMLTALVKGAFRRLR